MRPVTEIDIVALASVFYGIALIAGGAYVANVTMLTVGGNFHLCIIVATLALTFVILVPTGQAVRLFCLMVFEVVSKGYTEATVTKGTSSDGNTTIRVEIPDVDDPARVLELVGRPASLYFTLKDLGNEASNADLEKEAFLNGREHLENAYVTTSDNGNYAIGLKFNTEGAKKFGEITSANVGKKTYIYVGGQKIMEPSINAAITNGSAIITGNYTYQSAKA